VSAKKRVQITDRERLIHRVAPDPGWVQDGEVSPEAFVPRPDRDNGQLSASDKGCTAQEAYDAWMQRFKKSKANRTLTVSVGQLLDAGLKVYDDSPDGELHVYIDFNEPGVDVEVLSELLARDCDVGP